MSDGDVSPLPRPKGAASGFLQPPGADAERRLSGADRGRDRKYGSSGGFLLANSVFGGSGHEPRRLPRNGGGHLWRSRRASAARDAGSGESGGSARGGGSSGGQSGTSSLAGTTIANEKSFPGTDRRSLDADAAQIVSMALNLSESRRQAAHRIASQPLPPRLAPLPPERLAGGSLRQHLLQQRRVSSRSGGPRIASTGSARTMTATKSAGQMLSDHGGKSGLGLGDLTLVPTRNVVSASTATRARRAAEHLELLAQYRRLLAYLPPLEPDSSTRPALVTSPPESPGVLEPMLHVPTHSSGGEAAGGAGDEPKLGRAYNPLQYIRNRKVRLREGTAGEGELQGFHDVAKVTEWVDEVARQVERERPRTPGGAGARGLPPFAFADEEAARQAASQQTGASRAGANLSKPRRPHVDWFVDPADMLADVYWLERDGNKRLVEDRHWRRLFPQDTDLCGPGSHNESCTSPRSEAAGRLSLADLPLGDARTAEHGPGQGHGHEHGYNHEHGHEHDFRERAHQKLRALRSVHHRHATGPGHARDWLRTHGNSMSESSDDDSERIWTRGSGSAAIDSSGRSLLEKQINERLQREMQALQLEFRLHSDGETQLTIAAADDAFTPPERGRGRGRGRGRPLALVASPTRMDHFRGHRSRSRRESRAETSGAESRGSVDVPGRVSTDCDTSLPPNSPDPPFQRDLNGFAPAIVGMDLSSPTSSRAASPLRNPLSKVKKSIFGRERGRERASPHVAPASDELTDVEAGSTTMNDKTILVSPRADDEWKMAAWRRSKAVVAGRNDRSPNAPQDAGAARSMNEDFSPDLGSNFRTQRRINDDLRGGVSKMDDLTGWRESEDLSSSHSSSDDSDQLCGRAALEPLCRTASGSGRLARRYLDVMPHFVAGERDTDASDADAPSRQAGLVVAAHSRTPSVSWGPESGGGDVGSGGGAVAAAAAAASRREAARLRVQLLSLGIQAAEMDRQTRQIKVRVGTGVGADNDSDDSNDNDNDNDENENDKKKTNDNDNDPFWASVARTCAQETGGPLEQPATHLDLYRLAGQSLCTATQACHVQWHKTLTAALDPEGQKLVQRVAALHNHINKTLIRQTRTAADEADETSRDLVMTRRLQAKRVMDGMERMLRRRRRRFRWARRAGWQGVEWALVGVMWYVWFVVVVARVVLGVLRGVVRACRWLLWL